MAVKLNSTYSERQFPIHKMVFEASKRKALVPECLPASYSLSFFFFFCLQAVYLRSPSLTYNAYVGGSLLSPWTFYLPFVTHAKAPCAPPEELYVWHGMAILSPGKRRHPARY